MLSQNPVFNKCLGYPQQAFFGIVFTILVIGMAISPACTQSNQSNNVKMPPSNPLLCDPGTGICALPSEQSPLPSATPANVENKVKVIYFTDPICSSCWGIEPQLRQLKLEYGHAVDIEYRMGGLLPDWSYNSGGISKPSDVAHHWDEVSAYYQMPIDGDIWLEDPLSSSFPPSIAFKAAQVQDPNKALVFLRRIREMVFMEKKNIAKWEHLKNAALETGLNPIQLKNDLETIGKQRFEEDLTLAKSMGVRGFPTLLVYDSNQQYQIVYGSKPYSAIEQALKKAQPKLEKHPYSRTLPALFTQFNSLTTREFAELSGLPTETAVQMLEKATQNGTLQKQSIKNGTIWRLSSNAEN